MLERICVFCGSNPGRNGAFSAAARATGRLLAEEGITLVYGGGLTGLMGAVADGALAAGGRVIGIIPQSMNLPRVVHEGLSELVVVQTMHERKAAMAHLSDAFIALPGGLGTFDELFETLTWSQLGYQAKPIGLLNIDGYFNPLVGLIDHAVAYGFVQPHHRNVFAAAEEAADLLATLRAFQHPSLSSKWTELHP